MHNHPLNLLLRFLLEIVLVGIYAYWSWHSFEGFQKYLFSLLIPVAGMLLWGIFKVPGDPGKAIVAIPGWVRILLEIFLFIAGYWMLRNLHLYKAANLFASISILHYLISWERIRWLLF
jgi:hypothetical protein